MDFAFSEEQVVLRDTIRKYLARKVEPVADELDRKGPMRKEEATRFLCELRPFGYLSALVPANLGGAGLDHVTWGLMHEELKRAYASLGGIVGITSSSTCSVAESASEPVRERILPGLLSGEKVICTAITEPNYGSDPSGMDTRAALEGDHYVINGTKIWISNGTIADYAVVVAQTDPSRGRAGIGRFLVEREVSPFTARELSKLGLRSFPTSELVFENCRVPRENLLTGEGFKKTLRALVRARGSVAIGAVGIGQAAIDASVRYARERKQFGRPIGSFQLIQEMIADMVAETEAARLLAYRLFFLLDRGEKGNREASIAKAFATEAAVRITSKAIQIHGAYGLSEEFPVARYFRDARCYTIPDGTTEIQKLIIGREVLGIRAFA
jgi:alkylation response protein AidB-like acyl-CoA dehydrogenase